MWWLWWLCFLLAAWAIRFLWLLVAFFVRIVRGLVVRLWYRFGGSRQSYVRTMRQQSLAAAWRARRGLDSGRSTSWRIGAQTVPRGSPEEPAQWSSDATVGGPESLES